MGVHIRNPLEEPIRFDQEGDFAAVDVATRALKQAGFSVGSMQAGSPRGLLLGDYRIAKWRNLTHIERLQCHGEMHGGRGGPVQIVPSAGAPAAVLSAFQRVRELAQAEVAHA